MNKKLLYIFILLQPFVDLFTALMTRFEIGVISLGVVIRGVFILGMLIYLFFFCKSKYRKKSIKYILVLGIFYFFYLITKSEILTNFGFLFNEITYIFKYSYFILLFIIFINYIDEYKVNRKELIKLFTINLISYSLLIITPFLTGTGFNSYSNNEGYGITGWFYSANEISAIFTMIYPFLFVYLSDKFNLKNCLFIIISILAIVIIGTKAPYYGMLLVNLFMLIYFLVNYLKKKTKLKQLIFVAIILIFSILALGYTPANINLEQRVECLEDYQNGTSSDHETDLKCEVAEDQQIVILSGREVLFGYNLDIYKNSNIVDKFFGIGFSDREVLNSKWATKMVEMDLFDVFFRFGIIGFIIYMIPVFTIIFVVAANFIKNLKKLDLEKIIYSYSTAIGIAFGFFIGHVFGAPSACFYLAFIAIYTVNLFSDSKRKLNKDKVTFLALHLGMGGIENATINSANSLSKTKDVEIISFYKLSDENLYNINDKIKIKYLYYGKPNKDELINSVKEFNILSFIKNAFIATKILFKKGYTVIKEIKNIKEGIVISTRIEFTVLLNEFGNKDVIKIAQEHYHHNDNKKYIRTMKYNYSNIDYVLALTDGLKQDYERFLEGNNTKVITMPNMLEEINYKKSNLTTKNVIFVGRLDKGKRINEIIDISSKIDNDWTFNIIGSGKEKESLENQIKELKLEDKVFLVGGKPHNEVLDYLQESSIFIMTSISEGLPMVLLEAMSLGVPCIAYETRSGINDIITNKKDGFIIKNRNETEMIKKLELLMNDDDLRKEFGKNAKLKANRFSKEEITKRWISFIDNIKLS